MVGVWRRWPPPPQQQPCGQGAEAGGRRFSLRASPTCDVGLPSKPSPRAAATPRAPGGRRRTPIGSVGCVGAAARLPWASGQPHTHTTPQPFNALPASYTRPACGAAVVVASAAAAAAASTASTARAATTAAPTAALAPRGRVSKIRVRVARHHRLDRSGPRSSVPVCTGRGGKSEPPRLVKESQSG